jgi:hypothetical protein
VASVGTVCAATRKAPAKAHEDKPFMINSADLKWMAAPPIFPPGAQMAVLQGDPSGATYTVRLKAGDGYRIPAHWHPQTENVTVISGTFHVGLGDKLDESKGTTITPGGFASMPARVHHYAWFTGETEVQVHGIGPFQLTYVNPADTPAAARK